MALKPERKASVPPLAEDVYCGACCAVTDLGMQYSEKYKKTTHRIMITWEIAGETVEIEGKAEPRVISREYSLAWGDKSELKKLSDALFGSGAYTDETFEAKVVLGKPCQLDIAVEERDDGSRYNRISGIIRLAKGQAAHEPREQLYYEIGDEATHGAFEKLPQWVQDKIRRSVGFDAVVDLPDKTPGPAEAAAKPEENKKTDEVPF